MAVAEREEVDLLRPSRRVRSAGERLPAGQRVYQRRLADVRAAREADLDPVRRRKTLERDDTLQELRPAGEELSARLPRGVVRLGEGEGQAHGCTSTVSPGRTSPASSTTP